MAAQVKTKAPAGTDSEQVVIDEHGTTATLKGFGWAKSYHLDLDPRVDLTKPIWEQVQRLKRLDLRATQGSSKPRTKRSTQKSKTAA